MMMKKMHLRELNWRNFM